jgi:hypothetical protein
MRLTEKQVIEFEEEQFLDNGKITLGEFETMVQANNKEITVTLTEKSHAHAEMMIHKAANPELSAFYKSECRGDVEWVEVDRPNWNAGEYFLCHPNHTKECLHWLNGSDVEFYCNETNQYLTRLQTFKHWQIESVFMNPDIDIRIKQEPKYVKVSFALASQAVAAWENESLYIVHDGEYKELKTAIEVLEHKDRLYRKVEKGE